MLSYLRHLLLSATLALSLFACNTPTAPATSVEAVPSDADFSSRDEVSTTNTPEPAPTDIVLDPISTQDLVLSTSRPSHQQLNDYLVSFLEPITEPPYLPRNIREVYYRDLNGNGMDELIMDGTSYVAVLLWQGDSYSEPLIFDTLEQMNARVYSFNSILEFEDWTHDGLEEIVFKYRTAFSATPFGGDTGIYEVIHCDLDDCRLVFEIATDYNQEDIINGGAVYGLTDITLFVDEEGRPTIRALRRGFIVNCCGGFDGPVLTEEEWEEEIERIRSFRVSESIVWTYVWDGKVFQEVSEEVASLAYEIPPTAQYQALNKDAAAATLSITSPEQITSYVDDQCLVLINGGRVGDWFQCQKKYTRVEWRDVTGDRQEEVVVTALVGTYKEQHGVWQDCTRQHVFVYQWDGKEVTNIADVEACVVEADMFGVRIEDHDADGQLEILVANPQPGWKYDEILCGDWEEPCWYNREYEIIIYEWNGSVFAP